VDSGCEMSAPQISSLPLIPTDPPSIACCMACDDDKAVPRAIPGREEQAMKSNSGLVQVVPKPREKFYVFRGRCPRD
jgi:hypothetical protein